MLEPSALCWQLPMPLASSPVLLGFSDLPPHPHQIQDRWILTLGLAVCNNLSVPANLLFNECPYLDWVMQAIDLGFGMVMFSDERLTVEQQIIKVGEIVVGAHQRGVAVEGEVLSLPGVARQNRLMIYD
jgi:fructose/tagatose bisphosphate aldolase